jgi:tetratricopeptide (TPR) repeat protein
MTAARPQTNRDSVFFPDPPWPLPIQEILDTLRAPATMAFYHAQLLHAVGTLLRSLAGFLASYYLYDLTADCPKLNSCIATDLRRPTYGNLLAFLRACAATDGVPTWGPLAEVVRGLRSALRLKHAGLQGFDAAVPAVDALINYRNRVAHGGGALSEQECQARAPALEVTLVRLLDRLRTLMGCRVTGGPVPSLRIRGEEMPLFPLAYEDPHPFLGLMEGYDTKEHTVRFVSVHGEWETASPWADWAGLLQQRGLLARSWDAIDGPWLAKRARAVMPACCRLPAHAPPLGLVGEEVRRCIDLDGSLAAADPDLAAAIYCATATDRLCFVLDPADRSSTLSAYSALSDMLGTSPSIATLPRGHALETLLARVTIVLYGPADAVAGWKELQQDYPGLQTIIVKKVEGERPGFRASPDLLQALFDAESAESGQRRTWADLPPDTQQWADTFAKIKFLIARPYLGTERTDPIRVWREFLQELLPRRLEPGLVAGLVAACEGSFPNPDPSIARLLADLGLLRTTRGGDWSWTSEWARAAAYSVALGGAQGRQQERLADSPPRPVTPEIATELRWRCREMRYEPPVSVPGGRALLALAATAPEALPLPVAPSQTDIAHFIEACALLVAWGRPDAVDRLLDSTWQALGAQALTADDGTLTIAVAVRRHGSPALAERLFAALAGSATAVALRAKHELAGVLRDRGAPGDRERAARLYAEVLATPNLTREQRIRSLCGTAENLMWLRRYDDARASLREALDGASDPVSRAMVLHRLATVCLHQGAHDEALAAIEEAVQLLGTDRQGPFAARCLDIYARVLASFERQVEAARALEQSLAIKRALGDRLGLQKGLLQLSQLREHAGAPDAATPALDALRLAERSNDVLGQQFIHRRLAVLLRQDPEARAYHLRRVEELGARTRALPGHGG